MISAERIKNVLQLRIDVPPVNVIDSATCKELTEKLLLSAITAIGKYIKD